MELPLEIQTFVIGDLAVVAVAGEIYAEHTLAIGNRSPFPHTFTVTVANGMSPGYVVSREAAAANIFEAGVSAMAPETGERIVQAALDALVRSRYADSDRAAAGSSVSRSTHSP